MYAIAYIFEISAIGYLPSFLIANVSEWLHLLKCNHSLTFSP